MDYTELYYNFIWGCYPFETDANKIKSQNLLDYLIETGINNTSICNFVENAPRKNHLSPEMLPDSLWDDSLLQRDTFYYHNILHLTSKAPTWNPVSGVSKSSKFYLEMIVNFSMSDLLLYYYKLFNIEHDLQDDKKDSGSFSYLLARFSKFSFVESIDFALSLMDYAKERIDHHPVRNVLDILTYESEVYELLKTRTADALLAKANMIVWR